MDALDHAGRGHIELEQFGEEHRLLALHVAAAGFPSNPRVVHRCEHEVEQRVGAQHPAGIRRRVLFDRDGLRRGDFGVHVRERERESIDQRVLRGQREAAFAVLFRDVELVLGLDVEGAVLLGQELVGAFAAGECLHELERVCRVVHAREHARLEDQREELTFGREPPHLGRRQNEFLLDADGLDNGFGQWRFLGARGGRAG